jgi:hypothetical protein
MVNSVIKLTESQVRHNVVVIQNIEMTIFALHLGQGIGFNGTQYRTKQPFLYRRDTTANHDRCRCEKCKLEEIMNFHIQESSINAMTRLVSGSSS